MGDKIGVAQQALAMFFGGFGIGFYYSWELTLVILSVTPAMVIVGAVFGKVMGGMTSEEQSAYAAAGGIAEEAFSSIRTVVAFNGQKETIDRFVKDKNTLHNFKKLTCLAIYFILKVSTFDCLFLLQIYSNKLKPTVDVGTRQSHILLFSINVISFIFL